MNTKAMGKFEVLETEQLAAVEGGGWVKCGLGVVGGALTGGVAGGAVGTVTLPIVGTVSGATAGFWGGAATGVATFC
ncbi:Blp family class II bacteriocin [Streptococcus cuniculipharyngis]|uniref:ComC/BlpC family peptide pheromone/bacteriocin n=1 Tax=Streptococcus cuniculipharyngis TaxID=1562651 RepID=A0A5C5SDH9_9STRE|nr:Blp family class II bacteriocin [Streptococcus cuniculipharyngis]TWS98799.1 ComC/BlpC family peptide pheromone/bacteriocin [Streptococcus cuniculipharyngis]